MVLARLNRYQKEIAFLLLSVFFAGGYSSLKAQVLSARIAPVHSKANSYAAIQPTVNLRLPLKPTVVPVADEDRKIEAPKENEVAPFIDGPGQPEMQSFQSVNANNLVDLFSGDFSYNVPLLDVGGYPVNLHYSSGVSMDQEASWVGLGWNINPGTITRNMRGVPDDFNGQDTIQKTFNIKDNITAGVSADFKAEIFGFELKKGISGGISYNNYTGPSLEVGLNPTLLSSKVAMGDKNFGVDSLNIGLGMRFSTAGGFSASPNFMTQLANKHASGIEGVGNIGLNFSSRQGLQDLTVSFNGAKKNGVDKANQPKNPTPFRSSISFARSATVPRVTTAFTSFQFSFNVRAGGAIFGFHPNGAISGYYSQQYIKDADRTTKLPAYGYLHYQAANGDAKGLLDFNRESDHPYLQKLPHIGIPVYTYDTYSITGEGTGGMFRPYRGDIGFVRDHYMKSKNHSGNLGLDAGGGNIFHAGVDLSFNYTYTANKQWETENSLKNLIAFREANGTFEPVYFRNPSEKTSNTEAFYNAVGGSDLARIAISDNAYLPQATGTLVKYTDQLTSAGTTQLGPQATKTVRDKRQQVISYLTAKEAAVAGLDTAIAIYPYNKFVFCQRCPGDTVVKPPILTRTFGNDLPCDNCRPVPPGGCDTMIKESRVKDYRLGHHLSQITVLNPDGRTYVYGIPAYNLVQKEVTFAVNSQRANRATGLVRYDPVFDDSTLNSQGKDHFYSKEETPAYAHSFLLSGVLSPDYVDVTGDGITPDDRGDAVKFNYTKIYSKEVPFRWRTPYAKDSANYNEGFRTDKSDDKGSYIYGEKEIWYLHSIESKTMVATFTLEDRLDSKGVLNEDGGKAHGAGLKRLKEIHLYAKKDLAKYGSGARPIKTVHFAYSYALCKGVENTAQDSGKLTLEGVWFSYNKNNKGRQNPYLFKYKQNPAYAKKAYDRWGNYKLATDNPHGLSNDEFPYAVQDSAVAAQRIAAWALDSIYLPSGGKMVVDYEADDYAYVQNRRAAQMFTLLGFSHTNLLSSLKTNLYGALDHDVVFVQLPEAVNSGLEFKRKYLEGNTKIFFRINVEMPKDTYNDPFGSRYENIPLYAEWVDAGMTSDPQKGWIKLKRVNDQSPLVVAAMQYLRLNLPSKAYPGSDVRGGSAADAMVRILLSIASNLQNMVQSFNGLCRTRNWVNRVIVNQSIVRLNSPNYKKRGGGLRVKRVRLFDNWKKMGGGKEAEYGQEYTYTTVEEINGKRTEISSGVATYEPGIGGEENPFRQPLEYTESSSIIGPTFGYYIDNPVAETFFPSPSVGYSKVKVASINRKKTRSANGFSETEFFTARDFPVKNAFTPFDRTSKRNFNSPLKLFIPDDRHYMTLSQGFKIELNDMHGKLKSQATYAETDSTGPVSYTRNYYLVESGNALQPKLSNTVPMLNTNGKQIWGTVGKDIELMVDLREQMSETVGANVQINNNGFILPFFIPLFLNIPSFIPVPNHSINLYRAASVMKVIQQYGILDSVVHFEKGSKVSVKNLLYDEETGDVVLSRTQNAFDDPVYNFNYLAHWGYDGMGPAYKNIGAVVKNAALLDGRLTNTSYEQYFVSGDEVLVTGKEGSKICGGSYFYNVATTTKKLWVVSGGKIGGSAGYYFIDREGKAYTGNSAEIKVIRSGRRNMSGTSIGTVTSLKNPIQFENLAYRLVFNDSSKVLAASANYMEDDWRGDRDRTLCNDSLLGTAVNPFIEGMIGNWRPYKAYTYYGKRAESNPAIATDIRKNGTFADFRPLWNYVHNPLNPVFRALLDTTRWVWNAEATLYNRKGYELENRDPLGRYNAGLYGYNRSLPVAVAQNAKYREIMFEGFEDFITDSTECLDSCSKIRHSSFVDPLPPRSWQGINQSQIDSTQKHTGKSSLRIFPDQPYHLEIPVLPDSVSVTSPFNLVSSFTSNCQSQVALGKDNYIPRFSPIPGKKYLISAWMKEERDCNCESYTVGRIGVGFRTSGNLIIGSGQDIRPTGNIIEGWQRMEAVIEIPANAAKMDVFFINPQNGLVYFDDLRIQPYLANMKSFVYHPSNLRLMAELDENNYATFYEYDDDGTLVRVKKETVKGVKTIKETRSALLKN